MPQQQQFDFHALADGVVRNNVGVDGITLCVRARCDGDTVVIEGTGQRLPAAVTAETTDTQPWLWFDVEGWGEGQQITVRCFGASASPDERPRTLPAGT